MGNDIISKFKGLSELQEAAIRFIYSKITANPLYRFKAVELSEAINCTRQWALKILKKLSSLGFIKFLDKRKVFFYKIVDGIKVRMQFNGQTYCYVDRFTAILTVIKSFFFYGNSDSFPSTNTEYSTNTNNNSTITPTFIKSPVKLEDCRTNLEAEHYISSILDKKRKSYRERNDIQLFERWKASGETLESIKAKINKIYTHKCQEIDYQTEKPTSILTLLSNPVLEDLNFQLDQIDSTMDSLRSNEGEWTPRQKGFWVGLKKKQEKIFKEVKQLLIPLFNL